MLIQRNEVTRYGAKKLNRLNSSMAFFIISLVGKSRVLAIGKSLVLAIGKSLVLATRGTEENASTLQRQEIFNDIDDAMRIRRRGLGKRKSFEHLVAKRDDREKALNEVKASNNLVGGRELRLYCRFRGKCYIAEKYKVSGFAFAADYKDTQRHPPRHNFMKRKH